MTSALSIHHAADVLRAGGVIAYPTEGVFGLGCMPHDLAAVEHLLAIKGRNKLAGLILIAADYELLTDWITPSLAVKKQRTASTDIPTTWIVTAAPSTPSWLTGNRNTLAVRITKHPTAAALSRAADSALGATMANRTGHRPAKAAVQARCWFGNQLDYVVPGAIGTAHGPSEIRVAHSGKTIRPVMTNI